jgi:hypothetical protein
MRTLAGGGRLRIPPREALPGPDTANFQGEAARFQRLPSVPHFVRLPVASQTMHESLSLTLQVSGAAAFPTTTPAVPPNTPLPSPTSCDTGTFAGLDSYTALLQRCWAQSPAHRPSFYQVVHELEAKEGSM